MSLDSLEDVSPGSVRTLGLGTILLEQSRSRKILGWEKNGGRGNVTVTFQEYDVCWRGAMYVLGFTEVR